MSLLAAALGEATNTVKGAHQNSDACFSWGCVLAGVMGLLALLHLPQQRAPLDKHTTASHAMPMSQ